MREELGHSRPRSLGRLHRSIIYMPRTARFAFVFRSFAGLLNRPLSNLRERGLYLGVKCVDFLKFHPTVDRLACFRLLRIPHVRREFESVSLFLSRLSRKRNYCACERVFALFCFSLARALSAPVDDLGLF